MVRFTFKFAFLIILLFFGMLLGMNMAEKGIYKVAGTTEPPQSFQIVQQDNQVEVMVLGKTYTSELPSNITDNSDQANSDQTPNTEQQEANEVKQPANSSQDSKASNDVNFVSNLGNKLGELFQIGTEKGLSMIAEMIE